MRQTRKGGTALFAILILTAAAWAAGPTTSQKITEGGLGIELSVEPVEGTAGPLREGQSVRVRLTLTDTLTGTPMSRLYPGAWLDLLRAPLPGEPAKTDCRERVQALVGGSLLSRPEVDLNAYYVLTLNEDATISVVDPLFGYGSSKLLNMVFLKSPGEDWALSSDGRRLFVSLPDANRVAVVDTASWKVVGEIETPPRPRRIGLQPDGHALWVTRDGGVSALDPEGLRTLANVATSAIGATGGSGGSGHDLAFSDDSRFVFVTNEEDGTVSVVDAARLAKLRDVVLDDRPVSIAWSSQAKRAYVTGSRRGTITAVDGTSPQPLARIEAGPGLGRIRFAPGGRLAFVVHPAKNAVHILDAASNRIIQTAEVEAEPDQVTFSDDLAYVRHRGSETVLMIPLKSVGEPGRPVPLVDFPGGQHPPGRLPRPTPADGIVQAAGQAAVLVANAEDGVIYFYKEGMAAPMGHFQNYGKTPRAVLVVDRSLREVRPGVYETLAQMGPAGRYELDVLLDSPRVVHCFPLTVAPDPALAAARRPKLDVKVEIDGKAARAGDEVSVRLRISDPAGDPAGDSAKRTPRRGLRDVQVLTFLSPGTWQQRQWAEEVGEGLYEIRFRPPEAGLYFVFVGVDSAGLPLGTSPHASLSIGEAGGPS